LKNEKNKSNLKRKQLKS